MIVDVHISQQPTSCYKNSTEECEGNSDLVTVKLFNKNARDVVHSVEQQMK